MDLDLEKYSLEDLRALRTKVDRAIASFETRKRREALAAAEDVARQHGFNLNDLTGKPGRAPRRTSAPGEAKYAHPDDASLTWSGRGRRPRWVTEMLDAGRSLEDMLV